MICTKSGPLPLSHFPRGSNYTLCPEKRCPWVKYNNNHRPLILNRNHWKLQRTHWHPFKHCVLNCKWAQFHDRDIIICFQRHTKNAIFQNKTFSVKSNEQSVKQPQLQMVFKISTVTFFLTKNFNQNTIFTTDTLIKWKVRQFNVDVRVINIDVTNSVSKQYWKLQFSSTNL